MLAEMQQQHLLARSSTKPPPQVGTLEYLAPEVLLKQPCSFPADIYSWAVSVNEIATGSVPFSDCTKDNPAAHTVLNFGYGRRAPPPPPPHDVPQEATACSRNRQVTE